MTNPAGSKHAEAMVMINPQAERNLVFEQLQWNQATIEPGRNPPFNQIAGFDLFETFIQRFDTRMQFLRLTRQLLLERTRGL